MDFNTKNYKKRSFSYETKASMSFIPISAQSWKKRRLLCESVFVPIGKWTLTLKMMEKEACPMKPKRKCHLSQWKKWVYGAQSLKKGRLRCESVFIPTDKWTLTLKMMER